MEREARYHRGVKLEHCTALVTGGAKRIGAAIARALSDAGARVAIHCHDSLDEAKELQHQCPGSVVIEADLADRDARDAVVPEAIRALGGLDILVNNAAIWEAAPLPEIDQQHWDRMLEINLTAPFFLAREAGRRMKEAGGGLIVNLTDWAVERPYPQRNRLFRLQGRPGGGLTRDWRGHSPLRCASSRSRRARR